MVEAVPLHLPRGTVYVSATDAAKYATLYLSDPTTTLKQIGNNVRKSSFLRAQDGYSLNRQDLTNAENVVLASIYERELALKQRYEIFSQGREAATLLLLSLWEESSPNIPCPYASASSFKYALQSSQAKMSQFSSRLVRERDSIDREAQRMSMDSSLSAEERVKLKDEIEKRLRDVERREQEYARHVSLSGSPESCGALRRMVVKEGGEEAISLLLLFLDYSDEEIARPRHLLCHPRQTHSDFVTFLRLHLSLPTASLLNTSVAPNYSSFISRFAAQIVGPVHRRHVVFFDEEDEKHCVMEKQLEFARAVMVNEGQNFLPVLSSFPSPSTLSSDGRRSGSEESELSGMGFATSTPSPVVAWNKEVLTTPQRHSHSSPSSPSSPPQKAPKVPQTWEDLLTLLELNHALSSASCTKTIKLFLTAKPARRVNRCSEFGLDALEVEMINDQLEELMGEKIFAEVIKKAKKGDVE